MKVIIELGEDLNGLQVLPKKKWEAMDADNKVCLLRESMEALLQVYDLFDKVNKVKNDG